MASKTLYPPIVDSYTPAFVTGVGYENKCRIYYSLSRFSSSVNGIKSIHFLITKQSSGENVVNTEQNNGYRFGATGTLIINCGDGGVITPVEGQDNLYYTDILDSDIKNGWTKSWIYKIQVRFSNEAYDSSMGQAAWLTQKANYFSEWSTYTITKAIDKPVITIPTFNYDSITGQVDVNSDSAYSISSTTLELIGDYTNTDVSEILYSYRMKLKSGSTVLEDTDIIYANQYVPNQFHYLFKRELTNEVVYSLEIEYETLNKYTETLKFDFIVLASVVDPDKIMLLTAEDELTQPYTSVEAEESDGRVALKLHAGEGGPYFGNVCIRRSDSRTNFTEWVDISIISIMTQDIDTLPLVYDYTIESGVWYKYGLQFIDLQGNRSALVEHAPIKREFEYSFLLGENNKQLRLMFDNNIGSLKSNFSDSKLNTLGGRFPFITRNGNMNYKTFPINGLISFNMDEDNLFTNLKDMYNYDEVVQLYKKDFKGMYDYTRERDFRTMVLDFLQDGKPKLFKSPTEGNIIVRLMDVNATPNQTLGRLVYSFTSTANEIAEANMENYLKYNFHTVGNYSESFAITEQKLGQLNLTVDLNTDLLALVRDKYNKINTLGTDETVISVENIELSFSSPKAVVRAGTMTTGYEIAINQDVIKIEGDYRNLGEYISLQPGFNTLKITKAGTETVNLIMDFTYTLKITPHGQRRVVTQTIERQLGQFSGTVSGPKERIYDQIYDKYFYDWTDKFRELNSLRYAAIEAPAGAAFKLWDADDRLIEPEIHIINQTGVLDLYDLGELKDIEFIGVVKNGKLDETAQADIIIDYECYLLHGYYG